jgi:hypothetical protein
MARHFTSLPQPEPLYLITSTCATLPHYLNLHVTAPHYLNLRHFTSLPQPAPLYLITSTCATLPHYLNLCHFTSLPQPSRYCTFHKYSQSAIFSANILLVITSLIYHRHQLTFIIILLSIFLSVIYSKFPVFLFLLFFFHPFVATFLIIFDRMLMKDLQNCLRSPTITSSLFKFLQQFRPVRTPRSTRSENLFNIDSFFFFLYQK